MGDVQSKTEFDAPKTITIKAWRQGSLLFTTRPASSPRPLLPLSGARSWVTNRICYDPCPICILIMLFVYSVLIVEIRWAWNSFPFHKNPYFFSIYRIICLFQKALKHLYKLKFDCQEWLSGYLSCKIIYLMSWHTWRICS